MSKTVQRILVAVVSTAVFAAPFATGAAVGAPACGIERGGNWTTVPSPAFKLGPRQLTSYMVDPYAPARMFVTNGKAVMRTTDGACSWKQVFALPATASPDSPGSAATSTILSIEIAERNRNRILLMIEEQAGQGMRPHVVRSDDGGESWQTGDVGLPLTGEPEALAIAPSDPSVAYLAVDVGGGSVDLLFASADGGQSWILRSNPTALTPSMGISDLTVDPLLATDLWAWGIGGLYRSSDGGASFQKVDDFEGSAVSTADVFHAGTGPARIAGFRPVQNDVLISGDGGATWLSVATPAGVTSSAHGDDAGDIYISANGHVYSFHPPSFQWLDLNSPASGLVDVATDRAGAIYARTSSTIEVYDGPLGRRYPPDLPDRVFDVPLVNPPEALQRRPPSLAPTGKKIVLDPGASRTVRYALDLPQRPLPLNVFFLLDTSDSMGATIHDLADSVADIVNQLGEERIALKVGIGAFRAYPDRFPPDPPCNEDQPSVNSRCEKNYVYIRVLDIQTPGPAVTTALETLESDAGGYYKSHLGALYQLATGEGQDVFPPGPAGQDVPPGLQANFEDNALRVVIHATDEAFGDDVPRDSGGADLGNRQPPEIPEFDEVAAAFNAKSIIQVGLSIGTSPRSDLARVAEDTGALAPDGGVDCGRGYLLEAGAPLVCPVRRNNLDQSHNLVPAIVNLLRAVPNSTDVHFTAQGNQRVIREVHPVVHRDVVLQASRALPFEVTYRCPLDLAGERFEIRIGARGDEGLLDSTETQIVCRAQPKEPSLPIAPPLFTLPILVAVPPPPPPPVSQLTSASQAQSQAQAQTGAAFQEEEEPQVAVAAAYREAMQIENAYEFEMVAYEGRRRPVSPYVTLGAGAVLASMAYAAMVLARQRSRRFALQYQRRR